MSTATNPAHSLGVPRAQSVDWRPSVNPWMVALSVMLSTFMVVLDSSIANVALPHIAGSLSASTDESTWVLTSYLVSNGIMLPASGWLARRIGRKRLLMLSILSFTGASMLCGMALNMPMLIVARILQGAGGGGMQPLAQSILLESFPPEQHGKAMAAYGVGIVVAPVIGPTLGGWITDSYSWRWIFYINLPVGLLALFMANLFIEDPPYLRNARRVAIDGMGFALMAVWLGALQLALDKGQEADWFEATWIRWVTALSVAAFSGIHRPRAAVPRSHCAVARPPRSKLPHGYAHHRAFRCPALRHHGISASVFADPPGLLGYGQWPGGESARTRLHGGDVGCGCAHQPL
jgi:DHA2 family multidrug resistance protein